MAKYIKKVAEVVERAMSSGHARDYPYEADKDSNIFILRHYGTPIVTLTFVTGDLQLGGYSVSDQSAIETALRVLRQPYSNITRSQAIAKKKGISKEIGGWYLQ